MNRRRFLQSSTFAVAGGTAQLRVAQRRVPVDFRYAPLEWQSTYCFPDDAHKSLVGEKGDLRYGFDRRRKVNYFPQTVRFTVRGMESDQVSWQRLESPGIPIIRTRIDRPEAFLELTTFATNRAAEGRVDNVILEVRPKKQRTVYVAPVVQLRTRRKASVATTDGVTTVRLDDESSPFLITAVTLRGGEASDGYNYSAPEMAASVERPLRVLFRFPQQGQSAAALQAGLNAPDELLDEARTWWRDWRPFAGEVHWNLPSTYNDFLTACTRNTLQARERVEGKLTFQVGPTTYRGLWVVDGNFILEAARYLGYDAEVQQGLETTWGMQRDDGSVVAAVETAHWKDTGIAMFSLVRQAELSQDWSYFRKMQPHILRGVQFLRSLRDKARSDGSTNGAYGLLGRGFGDGGIGGRVRDEFTNTLWALSGLRAVTEAAAQQRVDGFDEAKRFYNELRDALFQAARKEMRQHAAGFSYLPMILGSDPDWTLKDERSRPRPQTGQWALAQSIFPAVLFEPSDPIVRGYVDLMKACTQEDVPIETGWLPHEGLWNYDACFAAHAYLWAGEQEAALNTFTGFLNHATPLYCWREEQPLHGALTGGYVGDMPHNWASAECVLFLRHMLALESRKRLRLLEGIAAPELAAAEPYTLKWSPSRFGRLNLRLEPMDRGRGWRLHFQRAAGPAPEAVELPEILGKYRLQETGGLLIKRENGKALVDPARTSWDITWT